MQQPRLLCALLSRAQGMACIVGHPDALYTTHLLKHWMHLVAAEGGAVTIARTPIRCSFKAFFWQVQCRRESLSTLGVPCRGIWTSTPKSRISQGVWTRHRLCLKMGTAMFLCRIVS